MPSPYNTAAEFLADPDLAALPLESQINKANEFYSDAEKKFTDQWGKSVTGDQAQQDDLMNGIRGFTRGVQSMNDSIQGRWLSKRAKQIADQEERDPVNVAENISAHLNGRTDVGLSVNEHDAVEELRQAGNAAQKYSPPGRFNNGRPINYPMQGNNGLVLGDGEMFRLGQKVYSRVFFDHDANGQPITGDAIRPSYIVEHGGDFGKDLANLDKQVEAKQKEYDVWKKRADDQANAKPLPGSSGGEFDAGSTMEADTANRLGAELDQLKAKRHSWSGGNSGLENYYKNDLENLVNNDPTLRQHIPQGSNLFVRAWTDAIDSNTRAAIYNSIGGMTQVASDASGLLGFKDSKESLHKTASGWVSDANELQTNPLGANQFQAQHPLAHAALSELGGELAQTTVEMSLGAGIAKIADVTAGTIARRAASRLTAAGAVNAAGAEIMKAEKLMLQAEAKARLVSKFGRAIEPIVDAFPGAAEEASSVITSMDNADNISKQADAMENGAKDMEKALTDYRSKTELPDQTYIANQQKDIDYRKEQAEKLREQARATNDNGVAAFYTKMAITMATDAIGFESIINKGRPHGESMNFYMARATVAKAQPSLRGAALNEAAKALQEETAAKVQSYLKGRGFFDKTFDAFKAGNVEGLTEAVQDALNTSAVNDLLHENNDNSWGQLGQSYLVGYVIGHALNHVTQSMSQSQQRQIANSIMDQRREVNRVAASVSSKVADSMAQNTSEIDGFGKPETPESVVRKDGATGKYSIVDSKDIPSENNPNGFFGHLRFDSQEDAMNFADRRWEMAYRATMKTDIRNRLQSSSQATSGTFDTKNWSGMDDQELSTLMAVVNSSFDSIASKTGVSKETLFSAFTLSQKGNSPIDLGNYQDAKVIRSNEAPDAPEGNAVWIRHNDGARFAFSHADNQWKPLTYEKMFGATKEDFTYAAKKVIDGLKTNSAFASADKIDIDASLKELERFSKGKMESLPANPLARAALLTTARAIASQRKITGERSRQILLQETPAANVDPSQPDMERDMPKTEGQLKAERHREMVSKAITGVAPQVAPGAEVKDFTSEIVGPPAPEVKPANQPEDTRFLPKSAADKITAAPPTVSSLSTNTTVKSDRNGSFKPKFTEVNGEVRIDELNPPAIMKKYFEMRSGGDVMGMTSPYALVMGMAEAQKMLNDDLRSGMSEAEANSPERRKQRHLAVIEKLKEAATKGEFQEVEINSSNQDGDSFVALVDANGKRIPGSVNAYRMKMYGGYYDSTKGDDGSENSEFIKTYNMIASGVRFSTTRNVPAEFSPGAGQIVFINNPSDPNKGAFALVTGNESLGDMFDRIHEEMKNKTSKPNKFEAAKGVESKKTYTPKEAYNAAFEEMAKRLAASEGYPLAVARSKILEQSNWRSKRNIRFLPVSANYARVRMMMFGHEITSRIAENLATNISFNRAKEGAKRSSMSMLTSPIDSGASPGLMTGQEVFDVLVSSSEQNQGDPSMSTFNDMVEIISSVVNRAGKQVLDGVRINKGASHGEAISAIYKHVVDAEAKRADAMSIAAKSVQGVTAKYFNSPADVHNLITSFMGSDGVNYTFRNAEARAYIASGNYRMTSLLDGETVQIGDDISKGDNRMSIQKKGKDGKMVDGSKVGVSPKDPGMLIFVNKNTGEKSYYMQQTQTETQFKGQRRWVKMDTSSQNLMMPTSDMPQKTAEGSLAKMFVLVSESLRQAGQKAPWGVNHLPSFIKWITSKNGINELSELIPNFRDFEGGWMKDIAGGGKNGAQKARIADGLYHFYNSGRNEILNRMAGRIPGASPVRDSYGNPVNQIDQRASLDERGLKPIDELDLGDSDYQTYFSGGMSRIPVQSPLTELSNDDSENFYGSTPRAAQDDSNQSLHSEITSGEFMASLSNDEASIGSTVGAEDIFSLSFGTDGQRDAAIVRIMSAMGVLQPESKESADELQKQSEAYNNAVNVFNSNSADISAIEQQMQDVRAAGMGQTEEERAKAIAPLEKAYFDAISKLSTDVINTGAEGTAKMHLSSEAGQKLTTKEGMTIGELKSVKEEALQELRRKIDSLRNVKATSVHDMIASDTFNFPTIQKIIDELSNTPKQIDSYNRMMNELRSIADKRRESVTLGDVAKASALASKIKALRAEIENLGLAIDSAGMGDLYGDKKMATKVMNEIVGTMWYKERVKPALDEFYALRAGISKDDLPSNYDERIDSLVSDLGVMLGNTRDEMKKMMAEWESKHGVQTMLNDGPGGDGNDYKGHDYVKMLEDIPDSELNSKNPMALIKFSWATMKSRHAKNQLGISPRVGAAIGPQFARGTKFNISRALTYSLLPDGWTAPINVPVEFRENENESDFERQPINRARFAPSVMTTHDGQLDRQGPAAAFNTPGLVQARKEQPGPNNPLAPTKLSKTMFDSRGNAIDADSSIEGGSTMDQMGAKVAVELRNKTGEVVNSINDEIKSILEGNSDLPAPAVDVLKRAIEQVNAIKKVDVSTAKDEPLYGPTWDASVNSLTKVVQDTVNKLGKMEDSPSAMKAAEYLSIFSSVGHEIALQAANAGDSEGANLNPGKYTRGLLDYIMPAKIGGVSVSELARMAEESISKVDSALERRDLRKKFWKDVFSSTTTTRNMWHDISSELFKSGPNGIIVTDSTNVQDSHEQALVDLWSEGFNANPPSGTLYSDDAANVNQSAPKNQREPQSVVRGSVALRQNSFTKLPIIDFTKGKATASTFLHETIHWLRMMKLPGGQDLLTATLGPDGTKDLMKYATNNGQIAPGKGGYKGKDGKLRAWRAVEERIAVGVEKYFHISASRFAREFGSAASPIARLAQYVRNAWTYIYGEQSHSLPPEVIASFDELFTGGHFSSSQVAQYEKSKTVDMMDPEAINQYFKAHGLNPLDGTTMTQITAAATNPEVVKPSKPAGMSGAIIPTDNMGNTPDDSSTAMAAIDTKGVLQNENSLMGVDDLSEDEMKATPDIDPNELFSYTPVATPRATFTRSDLMEKYAKADSSFTARMMKAIIKTGSRLVFHGTAPLSAGQAVINAKNQRAMVEGQMTRILDEINRAVEGAVSAATGPFSMSQKYDVRSMINKSMNDFLSSPSAAVRHNAIMALTPECRVAAIRARFMMDRLSDQLVYEGIAYGPLAATIQANRFCYIHRTYNLPKSITGILEANKSASNWHLSWIKDPANAAVYNKAIQEMQARGIATSPDDAQQKIENIITSISSAPVNAGSNPITSPGGLRDRTLTDEMATILSDLIGTETNAQKNFANTVYAINRLLTNHRIEASIRDDGLRNGYIAAANDPNADPRLTAHFHGDRDSGHDPVSSTGNRQRAPIDTNVIGAVEAIPLGPLYGFKTSPEVAEWFNEMYKMEIGHQDTAAFFETMRKINGVWKVANTVYNPTSAMRNVYGAFMSYISNGHLWSGFARASKIVIGQEFGHTKSIQNAFGSAEVDRLRSVFDRLVSIGAAEPGSFNDMMDFKSNVHESRNLFLGGVITAPSTTDKALNEAGVKSKRAVAAIRKGFTRFYMYGDAYFKMAGFFAEHDSLSKAFPNATADQLDRMAAERVQACMFSFEREPYMVRNIKKNVLAGNFFSFGVGQLRAGINSISTAIKDISEGSARLKRGESGAAFQIAMGSKRLAGMAAMTIGAKYVASVLSSLLGWDDEKIKKARTFMPDFDKNGTLIFLSDYVPGENARYLNLSNLLPFSYGHDAAENLVKIIPQLIHDSMYGDPAMASRRMDEHVSKMVWQWFAPFLDESASIKALNMAMRGVDESGNSIYGSDQTNLEKGKTLVNSIMRLMVPGGVKSVANMGLLDDGTEAAILGHNVRDMPLGYQAAYALGFRIGDLDMKLGYQRALEKTLSIQADAKSIFAQTLTKTTGKLSIDDALRAGDAAEKATYESMKMSGSVVDDALGLGMNPIDIILGMKDARIGSSGFGTTPSHKVRLETLLGTRLGPLVMSRQQLIGIERGSLKANDPTRWEAIQELVRRGYITFEKGR